MKILKYIKDLILGTCFMWLPLLMIYLVNIIFNINLD